MLILFVLYDTEMMSIIFRMFFWIWMVIEPSYKYVDPKSDARIETNDVE